MTTDEIRDAYLSFFESKGCVRRPPDLLKPPNDPSVLFTPAGMNQFKEQFLGVGKLEFTRATTCQPCIRTGDIENVGKTRFHMTMFEMLGNFSFGDYFKREAIEWAWEFCTKVLRIPPEKLHVTVYLDDDEAYQIWNEEIGLPKAKIKRCDESENYWPASAPSEGPDGVCGPCSEIYVDLGDGDMVEIWNLVFTQFSRVGYRNLLPLPNRNIDTGMGLERIALVMQNVPTIFEIDLIKPIVLAGADVLGVKYDRNDAESYRLRRIAEHARTVTFCLHEGIRPSNEKQGYVVRRLLRRAVLDGYQLGCRDPFLYQLVPAVVERMKKTYPHLTETITTVSESIKGEEERFLRTVETGMNYLEGLLRRKSAGKGFVSGEDAFNLHATYGFPIELTEDLAKARGATVDREAFAREMDQHRQKSGTDVVSGSVFQVGPIQELKNRFPVTEFTGYSRTEDDAAVVAVIAPEGIVDQPIRSGHAEPIQIILDRTPFYGESGGQVGDTGALLAKSCRFEVVDTHKTDGFVQHIGFVREGAIESGAKVRAAVDVGRRQGIQRAHSATHILHWALHQVLGKHATQAGSKVEDDLLRFDFHHPQAMTAEEMAQVERLANDQVMASAPIAWKVQPIEEARREGAMALFGEKYGDEVRVVTMGDFSREFCGGCHLSNTGQAGPVKIVREESVSAGVRRLTALTGHSALRLMREQSGLLAEISEVLKAKPEDIPARLGLLQKEVKDLQKELDRQKAKQNAGQVDDLLARATDVSGAKVIVTGLDGLDAKELQQQVDQLMGRQGSLAVLLAGTNNGKVDLICAVSADLVERGMNASNWVRGVAELLGGKGGGKPHLARAGGADPSKLNDALRTGLEMVSKQLAG